MLYRAPPPPDPAPPDPWVVRAALTTVALCVLAVVVLLLTACKPLAPPPATGTVKHVRDEPAAGGGERKVVTIEDAEGRTWNVRLPPDTRCVKDAAYPACAG